MKGLLLKDLYLTLKYCRLQLGVIVIMTLVSFFADTGMAFLAYPALFAGMIPIYLLSADEKDGWGEFAQTLPVTKRAMVTEKYVVTLVSVFAAAAFMALLWLGRLVVTGGELARFGSALMLVGAIGLLYPAVVLPLIFRFGVEKGRFVAAAAAGVAALAFVFLGVWEGETSISTRPNEVSPWLIMAVAALFALSWLIAVRLYEGREL